MKTLFLLFTATLFSLSMLQAQTTLWTEDLESTTADGSIPTGWAREVGTTSIGVFNDAGLSHGGSNYLNIYGVSGTGYAFTKAISMTAGNDYELKFFAKEGNTAYTSSSTIDVYIATGQTSGDISGGALLSYTNTDTYAEQTVSYSCTSTGTYYFVVKGTLSGGAGVFNAYCLTDDYTLTETAGASGPSISLSPTHPSCNGGSDGSISATVSGGATPYSYAWSNGATIEDISGLSAGVYNLTVTDNASDVSVQTTTVTDPATLSITSETFTSVTCNGGSNGTLTIMATGGTGTLDYDIGSANNTTGLFTGLAAGDYMVTITDDNSCQAIGTTQSIPEPLAIALNSLSTSDVSTCGGSDGEIHITGSGGTGTLSYDDGSSTNGTGDFTGLSAGNYTITISDDNSCEFKQTNILVSETGAPVITLEEKTDISCYGLSDGTITVTATGGTGTLNYDIGSGTQTSGEFTGLAAASYTPTVTDGGGCTVYGTQQTISEPAQLSITAEAYTSVTGCHGDATGTLSYTATGGTGALSFDIGSANNTTGNFTGLVANDYKLTVTDANSCQAIGSTQTISQPAEITVDAGSNQTICEGTSLLLDVTSTGTVTWSGSISDSTSVEPTTNTTYYVTLTDDAGCTATDSIVISVNPAPTVELALSTDTLVSGNSATMTASGAASYTWSKTGLSGASVSVSPTTTATYTVTGTDANGCTDKTSETIIVVADDTDDGGDDDGTDTTDTYVKNAEQIQLTLYPNPSSGSLFVESGMSIDKVEIYTQSTLVQTIAPLEGREINLNGLPAGIYFVRLYSGESLVVKKISLIK